MTQPIRPVLIDMILLLTFIKLIMYNITITKNYFNYIYNPDLSIRMSLLYIIIYAVLYIGIHPVKYYDIIRIIFKSINVIVQVMSDNNNTMTYLMIINLFISIIILFLFNTQKLTKNIMITIGILSSFQIIYKIIWGYNTIKRRIIHNINYTDRMKNIEASDVIIHQTAEQDFNKIYELVKTINHDIRHISTLSNKEKQQYILRILMKLDLTNLDLEDEIKKKFSLETNQLRKYINNLKNKIKKIETLQKHNNELIKCVKKYS